MLWELSCFLCANAAWTVHKKNKPKSKKEKINLEKPLIFNLKYVREQWFIDWIHSVAILPTVD